VQKQQRLRIYDALHRWSSLVCTLFLLLLCVTGLPLIFADEIRGEAGHFRAPDLPASAPQATLDAVIEAAHARHAGDVPLFASQEVNEKRVWYVTLGASLQAADVVQVAVDARTAAVLGEPQVGDRGVMAVVRALHVDLLAGQVGKLFLGAMGVLFLLSLISGALLYAPFVRKREFGVVRRGAGRRSRWLDLHNLIGIVILAWAFVVGATGAMNACADLLLRHYRTNLLSQLPAGGPDPAHAASLQAVLEAALADAPGRRVSFIAFPGTSFADAEHYGIFLRDGSALGSRLSSPVMVGRDGRAASHRGMPWYLTALLLSEPLHFGDYGGLPLKILWALLDLITVVVLISGVYLWFARGRQPNRAARRGVRHAAPGAAR
jgi:uncharacterized iron-regulated membrane protein